MNTRGIVQLVVLNIGVELGIISPLIFSIFVLMATILTFFTSPILSLLYRQNYDIRKLSVPNVALDLSNFRGREISMTQSNNDDNNISTISNGDTKSKEWKRSSIKSLSLSIPSTPVHDTFVTFSDRVTYADIDPNTKEEESSTENPVGTRMTSPRRSICMTRF
jgi:hypothetical protein